MKNNSLLSLLLLAGLASAAQAADPAETTPLPAYVVEGQRYSAAEQQVNDSLARLRSQANAPVVVSVELPALKAQVARATSILVGTRVAKS